MANDLMMAQMSSKKGFIAALDQSGGSTPGALRHYGIPDGAYNGEADMFRLIHEMRVRIITAPAFTGDKVIGAILFEGTMDGQAGGKPVPSYLWEERGVVPFVKVDKGLEAEKDGVKLMKPMPGSGHPAGPSREPRRIRHQDALRHRARLEERHRGDRGSAVRGGGPDRGAGPHADHRAGSLDQQSGQGRAPKPSCSNGSRQSSTPSRPHGVSCSS